MATLVTGANGFLGQTLCAALESGGHSVRRVTRADIGDIDGRTDWSTALSGIESVVHCAGRAHISQELTVDPLAAFRSVNTEGTLNLASQAVRSGVKRFVFISSIGVNGLQTFDVPFRADDPANPLTPYAVSKYQAEIGLRDLAAQTGLELVIIRPPLVVGANPKGNLAALSGWLKRGIPLPFGAINGNRRDVVSVSNVVSLVTLALVHPSAPGQIFLVSDGKPLSTKGIVEAFAKVTGMQARLVSVPVPILAWALKILGKPGLRTQLLGNLEIDISHAHQILGWDPDR